MPISNFPLLEKVIRLDDGLPQGAHFNHHFEDPVSKYSYFPRYWALGLQHMNFGGDTIQPHLAQNIETPLKTRRQVK
jgi:hypothetical protein